MRNNNRSNDILRNTINNISRADKSSVSEVKESSKSGGTSSAVETPITDYKKSVSKTVANGFELKKEEVNFKDFEPVTSEEINSSFNFKNRRNK